MVKLDLHGKIQPLNMESNITYSSKIAQLLAHGPIKHRHARNMMAMMAHVTCENFEAPEFMVQRDNMMHSSSILHIYFLPFHRFYLKVLAGQEHASQQLPSGNLLHS